MCTESWNQLLGMQADEHLPPCMHGPLTTFVIQLHTQTICFRGSHPVISFFILSNKTCELFNFHSRKSAKTKIKRLQTHYQKSSNILKLPEYLLRLFFTIQLLTQFITAIRLQ